MSETLQVTRRRFLKTTGLAAASATALSAKSYARVLGANDRLNMAFIATAAHLPPMLKLRKEENVDIRAICDVYETRMRKFQEKVKAAGGDPKTFHDYHDILAMKDIDYVTIATPEHGHARPTLDALDAGKHVYVEKPITHTIEEAQAVLAKVKQTGLKLQVGVQGMADESYSAAHKAIQAGKLGPLVHAQIEYCRHHGLGVGPWGVWDYDHKIPTEEDYKMPKPADLDWEAWLGPAPKRPWEARRYFEWRVFRDYSGGIATDLFVHRLTRIIKSCGLTFPKRAVGMGGIYIWKDGREVPDNMEIMVEYPPIEGITPGMTVHVLGTMANNHAPEHCIRGHKATLVFKQENRNGNRVNLGWEIIETARRGDGKVIETYEKKGDEDVGLHHKNHHAAIRHGTALNCPAELGLYCVAAVVMANKSLFQHKVYAWDAEKGIAAPV
jgi:predicted dehydrogenase